MRGKLGYSVSPLVAVVDDYSGHQTYMAIKRGASQVINLAISLDNQFRTLQMSLARSSASPSWTTAKSSTPITQARSKLAETAAGSSIASDRPEAPNQNHDHESDILITLLCGRETVSSIARKFFCSERTMYRKIRSLYDRLDVDSRSELRTLIATNRYGTAG
ncbi:hypothetical protein GCM10009676_13350 [Prauserella halophila]|uniref:HTH luxR-type domain-containing protein n=1 Tax=Prauserella halophila TaxID=185641 RepID=A0ABN1W4W7_9PSEU